MKLKSAKKTKAPKRSKNTGGKKRFTYTENKEFGKIDSDILKLENMLSAIEKEMTENWSDHIKMQELARNQKELQGQLNGKMERGKAPG